MFVVQRSMNSVHHFPNQLPLNVFLGANIMMLLVKLYAPDKLHHAAVHPRYKQQIGADSNKIFKFVMKYLFTESSNIVTQAPRS